MVGTFVVCSNNRIVRCLFICFYICTLIYRECVCAERSSNESDKNDVNPENEKSRDRDATKMLRVPVYGNLHKFAYYYTFLNIGNPPQKQMAIIDTGSQLVNFACSNCSYCGNHVLKNLDPKNSYTSSYITCKSVQCKIVDGKCNSDSSCGFVQTYSEGSSVYGKYISDVINFDSVGNRKALSSWYNYIGCVNKENDLIYSQISNGILGLSKVATSEHTDNEESHEIPAFIERFLNDHYEEENNLFALCLSENGGIMTIGGFDESYNADESEPEEGTDSVDKVKWISLLKSDLYTMRINRVEFMGNLIEVRSKKFILDSGTTLSILETGLFRKIVGYFQSLCTTIEYVNMNNSIFSRNKILINQVHKAVTGLHGSFAQNLTAKTNSVVETLFNGRKKRNMSHEDIKKDDNQINIVKCIGDSNTHNLCFSDISKMPSIYLKTDTGERVEWFPHSYFLKRNSRKFSANPHGWWCLGIEEGNLGENILGATFFKGNHLVFDLHSNRIGISRGNCPSYV